MRTMREDEEEKEEDTGSTDWDNSTMRPPNPLKTNWLLKTVVMAFFERDRKNDDFTRLRSESVSPCSWPS